MHTYEIIKNRDQVIDFIDWLPKLEPHEIYYVALIARKKYDPDCPSLGSDKQQVKRFTATKEWLIKKIDQLECKLGAYKNRDGTVINQRALALYINVNPRNQRLAAKNAAKKLMELAMESYSGYNTHQIAMSEIQKAKSKKRYFDLDFDGVDSGTILCIIATGDYINKECLTVLETRGGFHLLIDLEKIKPGYKKSWYNKLRMLPGCDVVGDNMIPIPGCTQGDFTPNLIL